MTTRNLDAVFTPRAVALVGASNEPGSLGAVLARNLLESGFDGPIMPINPHAGSIRSALAYRSVSDLPIVPDLAIIATPAPTIPGLISQLGQKGCRAAVVISAGFNGEAGNALKHSMLAAARPYLLRVIGPNCLGVLSPVSGLNASFAHLTPRAGGVALVAQSGAITTAALDWADGRGFGFSRVVTLGDMADVDFGDILDFLALDPATKGIILYVESVTDARKFMTAGRIAARTKPVVVMKAGRSLAGAKAAYSHTGALAGSDAVYDAAFRRAGMVRVKDLRELFDAAAILTSGMRLTGDRLAILTNGGGAGVLAADALEELGGRLAELSPASVDALNKVLPATWSHGNPIDIIGDATPDRYDAAMEAVIGEAGADALLVLSCPTAMTDSLACAERVTDVVARAKHPLPVLTCWLGDPAARAARLHFAQAGLSSHETPAEAVQAFMHLAEHQRNQQALLESPPAGPAAPHRNDAKALVAKIMGSERRELTEPETKAVLAAYGIPVLASQVAATADEAGRVAETMTAPFAVKILSPDITHKSDVGGVVLNLSTPEAVREAANAILAKVSALRPEARTEGFVIQTMVSRPRAIELIAGIATDTTFGPVVLFGQGGVAVETLADRVVGLPPLNRVLARDMIDRTRVARLLNGYRDVPRADIDAVADVLERLAMLALDIPEIIELDINPLLSDAQGVIGLDARARLSAPGVRAAIRPYPDTLASKVTSADGEAIDIRPVLASDGPGLAQFFSQRPASEIRLRFAGAAGEGQNEQAARLSQIDYDREMVFLALAGEQIVGLVRLAEDPERARAELALLIPADRKTGHVGEVLLRAALGHASSRGVGEVCGAVGRENRQMLVLARELGFHSEDDAETDHVRISRRTDPPDPQSLLG